MGQSALEKSEIEDVRGRKVTRVMVQTSLQGSVTDADKED
jgi:hypothetical protein